MIVDEWKATLNRLVDMWEQLTHTLQRTTDALIKLFDELIRGAQNRAKTNPFYSNYHRKKSHYLCNKKTVYKIERKPQKNIPFSRRNY